ncbi:MAG: VWA domain-containing protein [Fuerstiella sp.]
MMRFQPRQTPVVSLIFTRYEAPLYPNSWAFEDREALEPLNGVTLQLFDIPDQGNPSDEVLREFQATVRSAATEFEDHEPLIVYLSGHAAVKQNTPCLLTSASELHDRTTWLTLDSLLNAANEARSDPRQPLLFLIDACRFNTPLNAITNADQFHDALAQLIADSRFNNLTVITTCSSNQQAHAEARNRHTIFGQVLQQALSGLADRQGDGNKYVSLPELVTYLQQQVAKRAQVLTGQTQSVSVLQSDPADRDDYTLCWVAQTQLPDKETRPPVDTPIDLQAVWAAYETARQEQPFHSTPQTWGTIESDLLRLQAMVDGGASYQVQAASLADQLQRQLAQIAATPAQEQNLTAAAFDNTAESASYQKLQEAIDAEQLISLLQAIDPGPTAAAFPQLNLAYRLAQQPTAQFWKQPGLTMLALQTRAAADALGQAVGVETLPWIRVEVDAADDLRLQAEDGLFANLNSAEQFRDAQTQYQKAASRLNETQLALHTRNQVLAELLWYSRLYVNRTDLSGVPGIQELADHAALLTAALQQHEVAKQIGSSLPFQQATMDVRTTLQKFQSQLDGEYKTLLQQPVSSATALVRMRQLLSVPLLPSADKVTGETGVEQRIRLQTQWRDTVTRRLSAADLATDTVPDSAARGQDWQIPINAVLSPSDNGDDDHDQLRNQIAQFSSTVSLAVASTEPELHDYRSPLQNLSCQLRILAPLALFSAADDPVTELQQLDETLKRVWLAERSLKDFYGPARQGDKPYFAESAAHFLQRPNRNLNEAPAVRNRLMQAGRLLDQRVKAASDGLRVDAHNVLLMEETQLEPLKVVVTPDESLPDTALPQAKAAVYLADDQGRPHSGTLSMPVQSTSKDNAAFEGQLLVTDAASNLPDRLHATANLRGNLFRESVVVSRATGPAVVQSIESTNRVSVNVLGAATADTSAIVIFDCSQSMSEIIAAETVSRRMTKFQAAQQALQHLLEQVADLDGFRVGLMLFGHRVGWNPQQPSQLLTQDQYIHGVPPGLRPYEDVEMLLPVGRFDRAVLQGLAPALRSIRPWGETPLYLALSDALEGLQTEDPRRTRRIIVITDGANYQVNPTIAKRRTVADIQQQLVDGVQLDIIGFRIADAEAAIAAREFEALTNGTGGKFISVSEVDELMRSLSGLIRQEDFEVTLPGGHIQVSKPGTAINFQIEQPPSRIGLRLADASSELTLFGGEAVELQLSSDRQSLRLPPGTIDGVRQVPLFLPSGAKSPVLVNIGRLTLEDDVVQVTPSVLDEANLFVARPAALQVSIQPLDDEHQPIGPTYVADITHWQPRTAFPTASLKLNRWPDQARQADIRILLEHQTTAPVDSMALADLTQDGHLWSTRRMVNSINGVELFVIASKDFSRINVIQKHDAESPGLDGLLVRLKSDGKLRRCLRRTDTTQKLVVTVFEFSPQNPPEPGSGFVELILRDDLQHNALRVENPVRVPVSVSTGLLLPTAQ